MITLDSIREDFHAIAIKDSANGYELLIDSSGHITSNINGSVTVSASDLDIRDLTSASDSVEIKTAAGQALDIDASGYITANQGTSPWVVSATDFDIRAITHDSDSIKIGDGTDFIAVNSDGSLNVQSAPAAFDSWKTSVSAMTATVAEIAATPLANRLEMLVQNVGNNDVYLGEANTVTISTGYLLPKGSSQTIKLGIGSDLWGICDTGKTASLRVAEYAN